MRYLLLLLLLFVFAVRADDLPWIFEADSNSKVIMNIDQLPHDYLFEFWFAGSGPVITKDKLIEAIESTTHEKLTSNRPCVVMKDGSIDNYPC